MTEAELRDKLSMARTFDLPQLIAAGPIFMAAYQALLKFAGRDHRRIKREVNKAMRRAKLRGA